MGRFMVLRGMGGLGGGVGEFDDGDFAAGATDFQAAHVVADLEDFDAGFAGFARTLGRSRFGTVEQVFHGQRLNAAVGSLEDDGFHMR